VTRRLLLSYLTVTLVVLLVLGIPLGMFYAQRERERIAADLERDANVIATVYEDALQNGVDLDPVAAETYAARTDARVVVVDGDGIARVDTLGEVPRDFSTRPEIQEALDGARTSGTRSSDTLDTGLLYVAVPVASGGDVYGAVRVTLDTADVSARIRSFWLALGAVGVVVLVTVGLIGWVLARSLTRPLREVTSTANRFASGDLTVEPGAIDGPHEIRELDESMTTMAIRLDGLLSTQRAFVADASHQLRTPLTALRLRLENLQVELADSQAAAGEEVERAIDETTRLTELVTSLLQLARTDDRPATTTEPLLGLVRDRVDTWTAVAEERGVRLIGPSSGEDIEVHTVAGGVEQILDNLLDNALGVAPPGTAVEVELAATGEEATLRIVDHGPGLSATDKRDAVRRFWRGDTSRPGTGLGLAIVDALATAAGGSTTLEDTPGGGLTVVVTLRRARDEASR
jgi:signal transduction histidine kinase